MASGSRSGTTAGRPSRSTTRSRRGLDHVEIHARGVKTFADLAIGANDAGDALVRWDGGGTTITFENLKTVDASDFLFE